MKIGFLFPITTEDPNTGSWIFNPPRGSHPFPAGPAVCLDTVGRERSTNTLQSSGLAILRHTTRGKTDTPLGNHARNLSYTLFTNRSKEQQQRSARWGRHSASRVRRNIPRPSAACLPPAEAEGCRLVGAPGSGFLRRARVWFPRRRQSPALVCLWQRPRPEENTAPATRPATCSCASCGSSPRTPRWCAAPRWRRAQRGGR